MAVQGAPATILIHWQKALLSNRLRHDGYVLFKAKVEIASSSSDQSNCAIVLWERYEWKANVQLAFRWTHRIDPKVLSQNEL